jgi:hypothetical protein
MSYSRWTNSRWYTFWCAPCGEPETKDNAVFTIMGVISFTAKELRDNLDDCMDKVAALEVGNNCDPLDIAELKVYAMRFLRDVDLEYSKVAN